MVVICFVTLSQSNKKDRTADGQHEKKSEKQRNNSDNKKGHEFFGGRIYECIHLVWWKKEEGKRREHVMELGNFYCNIVLCCLDREVFIFIPCYYPRVRVAYADMRPLMLTVT